MKPALITIDGAPDVVDAAVKTLAEAGKSESWAQEETIKWIPGAESTAPSFRSVRLRWVPTPPSDRISFTFSSTSTDVRPVVDKLKAAYPTARTTMVRSEGGKTVEAQGVIESVALSGLRKGERIVKAPDGREIVVERSAPSPWGYAWIWRWEDGANKYMSPWLDGLLKPLDREPTDAEILVDYGRWLQLREQWQAKEKAEQKPISDRIIHAIDCTEIRIEHQGTRRHEPECWRARWPSLEGGVDHTHTWLHEPTSEEVLEVYEAWRQSRARTVVTWDGTRIRVSGKPGSWNSFWWADGTPLRGPVPGADGLWCNCPTDAEVLADYEAWAKARGREAIKRDLADLEKRAAELRAKL